MTPSHQRSSSSGTAPEQALLFLNRQCTTFWRALLMCGGDLWVEVCNGIVWAWVGEHP